MDAARTFDRGSPVVAKHLVHLVEAELIVPGGDGRVRREDTLTTDRFHVGVGRVGQGSCIEIAQLLLKQGDGKQGRVALIHVVNGGFASERLKQIDPAQTEDSLLTERR